MTDIAAKVAGAPLPSHIRPVLFSANELLLEMLRIARGYAKVDLESLLVLLCVNDATMRPFMLTDSDLPLPTSAQIDEKLRGSISRRMIADETGLPRETVRRKADELVEAGLLIVDPEGRLRARPLLANADAQANVDALHAAISRYQRRLVQFGVQG